MNFQSLAILTVCAAMLSSTLIVGAILIPDPILKTRNLSRRVLVLLAYLPALAAIVYWIFGVSLADDGTRAALLLGVFLAAALSGATLLMLWRWLPQPPGDAPAKIAGQNKLERLDQAIQQMLETDDVEARMGVLAKSLHDFGWGRVAITLLANSVLIIEPPSSMQTPDDLLTDGVWESRWQKRSVAELVKYRIGPGYFFAKKDIDALESDRSELAWRPGDLYVIPIRSGKEQQASLIKLSYPDDGQRPTQANMLYISILAAQAGAAVERSQLLGELTLITHQLEDQIDELVMMQHVDRELSATLDFDAVMMLTMDWAMRRTSASAGILNMITPDGTGVFPVAALGYSQESIAQYTIHNPLPLTLGIVGRAARTREMQIVSDTQTDPDYIPLLASTRSQVAVPMEMRSRVIGVLNLESDQADAFDKLSIPFLTRLAARGAVAMDNARLYREAESRASQMSALYSAGRAISSSLERADVIRNATESLAGLLDVSYTVIADYSPERTELLVNAVHCATVTPEMPKLPVDIGTVIELAVYPDLKQALNDQHSLSANEADTTLPESIRSFLARMQSKALLIVPMYAQDHFLGVVIAVEQRRERIFQREDIVIAESVASQCAAALRQAALYEDVRELENVKSEMIRMASHDLRNPLGNLMGYFEILVSSLGNIADVDQAEYIHYVRNAINIMKTLIEDLLTLDRLESEREIAWLEIDVQELVTAEVEVQQASAALKEQLLTLSVDHADKRPFNVLGSKTQLRQAIANLVSNAIKYTPDGGQVQARLALNGNHLQFEVEDNGYGISPERQVKLYQRFYRAREESTDHIPGTGLGLSMVKTVVERHGGKVWVRSTLAVGSTFGFWLPLVVPGQSSPDIPNS